MSRTAEQDSLSSQMTIKVDGSPINQTVFNDVLDVMIDQHAHLPAMFVIRLYDVDLVYSAGSPFELGKEVEISAIDDNGASHKLIKGEISALEPHFAEGRISYLVVRGFDKLHRLYREKKTVAHLNKKDSDIASTVASNAGLSAQVDTTSIVYDHLFQHNQSDMEFLMQRAWRIGFECFAQDGKLYFRKPPSPSSSGVKVTWGDDLSSFEPRVSLAEQVDEVQVKGWNIDTMEPIIGKASSGALYAASGESKNGAAWAGSFGTGKYIITDQPVVSQDEANQIAQARLDEISGAFIEATGIAFRRPDIIAGSIVEIANVGTRFSGKYLVTRARHRYSHDGLYVEFEVLGTRTGLLAEQLSARAPVEKWTGVVTAVVTNTDDPNAQGRVKVKYPWMSDSVESWWARVAGAGAGPEAGFFMLPEVGDEVLVAFEHGDFNRPFVLGGLWNGVHAIPPDPAGAPAGEIPLVRSWRGISGNAISMYDNTDAKIVIETPGGHVITMDDTNKKLTIVTGGGQEIIVDDNGTGKVTVTGNGDIEVSSGANMTLKSTGNMEIEASGTLTLKGNSATLDGGPSTTVKGGTVAIN